MTYTRAAALHIPALTLPAVVRWQRATTTVQTFWITTIGVRYLNRLHSPSGSACVLLVGEWQRRTRLALSSAVLRFFLVYDHLSLVSSCRFLVFQQARIAVELSAASHAARRASKPAGDRVNRWTAKSFAGFLLLQLPPVYRAAPS